MTEPKRSKDFMRFEEVTDGINVIVDDRFCALLPMECYAQVKHLVDSVNLAWRQRQNRDGTEPAIHKG